MPDDLRARIETAVVGAATSSRQLGLKALVDALTPLVESEISAQRRPFPRLLTVRDGRCRDCLAVVDARWLTPGESAQPHRMTCRFHVGPVAHVPSAVAVSYADGIHEEECTCGAIWTDYSTSTPPRRRCPNAAETWRGPRSEGDMNA